MRILFLGAGGTGGYFGGRAAQADPDVSFLLREKRAKAISEEGLRLCSPRGDALIRPNVETAGMLKTTYDLVVLRCKAYDIGSAIEAIRPAVRLDTAILPIMNGMLQYDILDREFGADRVLGGLCQINATLGAEGEFRHFWPYANLVFGERSGETRSPRCVALEAALAGVDFSFRLVADVFQDSWEKYVFLTSLAAATCLMRGSVGSIVSTNNGEVFLRALLGEAQSVAQASGYAVHPDADAAVLKVFTDARQPMTASMFRDLSRGNPVEADHIVEDMVHRASQMGLNTPDFRLAYSPFTGLSGSASTGLNPLRLCGSINGIAMTRTLYLAGFDVFREDSIDYGKRLKALCRRYGFDGIYPLDNAVPAELQGPALATWIQANMALIQRVGAVMANVNRFRGEEPDSGTAFEMGYAVVLGKPVWAYTGQHEPLVKQCATRVTCPTLRHVICMRKAIPLNTLA